MTRAPARAASGWRADGRSDHLTHAPRSRTRGTWRSPDEGELRSAVRAGANEAPDAARPLAEGAARGHHPGARRHRRAFQQVFVHYESTRAASSTNQSINAISFATTGANEPPRYPIECRIVFESPRSPPRSSTD